MEQESVSWHALQLWESGFDRLSVHYVVHLNGPAGTFEAGWSILTTDTGMWVASEVCTRPRALLDLPRLSDELQMVLNRSVVALSPF